MNEQKRQKLISQILAITENLNPIKDLDSLLDRILFEARSFTRADAGSIFLVEGNALKFSYVQNHTLFKTNQSNKHIYSNHSIPLDKSSIAGYAAVTGLPLNIENVYAIPETIPYSFNPSYDKLSHYRTVSMLTVPLNTGQNHVVGVLELINATDSMGTVCSFSDEDRLFATYFANHAAVAVERAIMTREMILRMLRMSEMRDPRETGAHVNRVGAFAAEVYYRWAQDHAVDPTEIKHNLDLLRLAAMMHDVGKVAISDTILAKPGKLTDEEFGIMKHHTLHGARLFKNTSSDLDRISREVALYHHERWDGKGYPGRTGDIYASEVALGVGYQAEEIPLFARIVALVDVYDALSSRRCYKEAWPQERVLDEIRKGSGSQFDPAVCEAFFSIYDVIEAIRGKYSE